MGKAIKGWPSSYLQRSGLLPVRQEGLPSGNELLESSWGGGMRSFFRSSFLASSKLDIHCQGLAESWLMAARRKRGVSMKVVR